MTYVIVRIEDFKYVAKSGSEHSYTRDLTQARTFASKEAAQRECCGNERAIAVADIVR